MNVVIDDFDGCVKHFTEMFDGNFMLDMPGPNWHACLIEIGGLIVEFFTPPGFMLNSRHGAHYLGVEFEALMAEARPAVAANNVRIFRDLEIAFHTDPADGFGVDYELFEGTFYGDNPMAATSHARSAEFWRDEHPAGFTGPVGYTQNVMELQPVWELHRDLFGAEKLYEADRPDLGAKAMGIGMAGCTVELLCPTSQGQIWREMMQIGQGIRSTIFGVKDIGQARSHFEKLGLKLIDGTLPGSFAIDPAANRGILFEFAEKP